MTTCKYCLIEMPDNLSECPKCGFPVSTPLSVENVKAKWAEDMGRQAWVVQTSLGAMHRAEKGAGDTLVPEYEREKAPQSRNQRPQQPSIGFDASAFDSFFNN